MLTVVVFPTSPLIIFLISLKTWRNKIDFLHFLRNYFSSVASVAVFRI